MSRKACAEAIRLAGVLGVTTAEGFLRLREPRRRYIVELARMRGRTHPLDGRRDRGVVKHMTEPLKQFDVHFSLNGFYYGVGAKNAEEAAQTAERWFTRSRPHVEAALGTGVGIEIAETLEVRKDV